MQQLVFAGLTREPVATAIALGDSDNVTSEGVGGGGGESNFESSSRQFVEFLDGMLQGVPVDAGVVGEGVGPVAGERKLAVWRDEYRKDAILGVSLCFRCSLHIGFLLCCGW